MTWLSETPSAVVDACLLMLPRLEADEARQAAHVVGVGRSFKPGRWAQRQLAGWNRDATGGQTKRAPSRADLAGIGVKMVKANG